MGVTLDLNNPVVRDFGFYCAVLVLKMLAMSPLTARHRLSKGIFISGEDGVFNKNGNKVVVDEDIERVRRAHRNDLENIPLFFIIGALYVLTDPFAWTAKLVFLAFTVARVGHTVTYLNSLQPHRFICFMVGAATTGFMALSVLLACL